MTTYSLAGLFGPQPFQDTAGNAIVGTLAVYTDVGHTTLAFLFTDQSKSTEAPNPVNADALGNYSFWAAPGAYFVVLTAGSLSFSQEVIVNANPVDPSIFATGPAGPQGQQGPAGPQGPMGLQGTAGAAGAPGADGAQGPQGPNGNDGAAGIVQAIVAADTTITVGGTAGIPTVAVSTAVALIQENVNTVAASSTAQTIPDVTVDTISRITLTGNCTFTFPATTAGKSFLLGLVQGTGPFTATWPGTVKWAGGTAPTLTATSGKVDLFTFVCLDGTNWLGLIDGQNF